MATTILKQPETRQVETVRLAPDAMVFINGVDYIKTIKGAKYEMRNDITDVSTSANTESPPSTANFTISYPDHLILRYGDFKTNSLRIMSEVEIYYKGRFAQDDGNGGTFYPYYPTFWGMVSSISETYSDGVQTISVSCADMLRWWQITTTVIQPGVSSVTTPKDSVDKANKALGIKDENSVVNQGQATKKEGVSIKIGGRFAQKTIPNVLYDLASISTANLTPIDGLSNQIGLTDKINDKDTFNESIGEIVAYWKYRLDQVGKRLRIYGIKEEITKEDKKNYIFDNSIVNKAMIYPLDQQQPQATQSVIRTNLEIALECKEAVKWEFFQDVNGEITFKPPFYNLNVKNNFVSVIEDLDIIHLNFTQSESEIVTRMEVTGSMATEFAQSANGDTIKGIAYDVAKAQQYGMRTETRSIQWLNTSGQCLNYAKMELNRMNAIVTKGSMTIIGRPELRLGYPIYIPSRDSFYYVTGIDHSLTFGGTFTTNLSLVCERKNKGDKQKNKMFRDIGGLQDSTKSVKGVSESDKTQTNFLKNLIDPCRPTTVKKEVVTEPSYVKPQDTDRVLAMNMGNAWKDFYGITADPNSLKEIQVTDSEGYELVPFFPYGKEIKYVNGTLITTLEAHRSDKDEEIGRYAIMAQNLDPNEKPVSINNVAIKFEDEDTNMTTTFNKATDQKAIKAQSMGIK